MTKDKIEQSRERQIEQYEGLQARENWREQKRRIEEFKARRDEIEREGVCKIHAWAAGLFGVAVGCGLLAGLVRIYLGALDASALAIGLVGWVSFCVSLGLVIGRRVFDR